MATVHGETCDHSLLQAVSDWQRGGDARQNRRRGEALKAACQNLPPQFRESALECHRQIALGKGSVWDLLGDNRLLEKISSWTTELEIAQRFKGGVPPQGQGYQGVIFSILPPAGSVIVNLRTLYQDPTFRDAMERNKSAIAGYTKGAGLYGDGQSEVVLEVDKLDQDDVYSLGGHSSPFEELVTEAARIHFGSANVTPEQYAALLLKVEHTRGVAGPSWLCPEATKRVLKRTEPHAVRLRKIKALQDQVAREE